MNDSAPVKQTEEEIREDELEILFEVGEASSNVLFSAK